MLSKCKYLSRHYHHYHHYLGIRCFSKGSKSGDPVSPSITLSSTFGFETVEDCVNVAFGKSEGHFYTRWGNPTVQLVEEKINELESGNGCLMFGSGMAAISSVIQCFVKSGDHIIVPIHLYSATNELFQRWLPMHNNIQISWIDTNDSYDGIDQYQKMIKSNTKLIYAEIPSNPMNCIIDLSKFSNLAKENGIITAIDSTFASPFNQLPIKDHDIDIVIHAATKILNGHSDVTAGTVICKTYQQYEKLADFRKVYGPILSPFDCYLIHRGLKTLPIRADRINKSAIEVAKWIEQQKDIINQVHYCGLPSFRNHDIAKKNLRRGYDGDNKLFWNLEPGFGGTFSFEIKNVDRKTCSKSLDELELITRAVSLGGTESLIEHVASTTHNESLYDETESDDIPQIKVSEGLVRLNIGLEAPELIINDLQKMFDYLRNNTMYKKSF